MIVAGRSRSPARSAASPARPGSRARRRSRRTDRLIAPVVVEPGPDDRRVVDLGDRRQHVHRAEALALQPPQPAPQLVVLAPDHVGAEVAVRPGRRCGRRRPAGGRSSTIATGSTSCSLASATSALRASGCTLVASTTVSRPAAQPHADDVVQQLEGRLGRRLVVLVVGHQPAAEVGGDHLGGPEVRAGRRSTCPSPRPRPAPPGSAPGSQLTLGPIIGHPVLWSKTASWVGGPTSGSSAPTGSEPHAVAVRRRHPLGPAPRTRPGSTRTGGRGAAASPAGRVVEAHVVLDVRRGHDHRARRRDAEHGALQGGQPGRVDVLDRPPSARRRPARSSRSSR